MFEIECISAHPSSPFVVGVRYKAEPVAGLGIPTLRVRNGTGYLVDTQTGVLLTGPRAVFARAELPPEITKTLNASTAHIPEAADRHLRDRLMCVGDIMEISNFEIQRTERGYLITAIAAQTTTYDLSRLRVECLLVEDNPHDLWYHAFIDLQVSGVKLDADAPVYPQWEQYDW